ncbi:MAG: glycosyltransferase [Rhodospirillaceae bacterium]|nr:glycosyltransferase [Rhodospirillaceae bacterium]
MRFRLFYHAWSSCWNHGNAHFLRGVARQLVGLGHEVRVHEPAGGWSRRNALAEGGAAVLAEAEHLVPGVELRSYHWPSIDLDEALDGADVVLVHEWTEPALVAAIGRQRARGAPFLLFFHDTHHRAVTAPDDIAALDLDGYDAVLAFGESLREVYAARGWGARAVTWHEAADTALFRPDRRAARDRDLVWIGNWGDGERSREIREFLIEPAARLGLRTSVHGVRYPDEARAALAAAGIAYEGWLPNHRTPAVLRCAGATVHIPRRPYSAALAGIPTIRVFEALACGVPLVCARWQDTEDLFGPGCFLSARDGAAMTQALALLRNEPAAGRELAAAGLKSIRARHTCADRVAQLLAVIDRLQLRPVAPRPGVAVDGAAAP